MVDCGFDLCESKMVQFQNWIQCLFLHPIPLPYPVTPAKAGMTHLLMFIFLIVGAYAALSIE